MCGAVGVGNEDVWCGIDDVAIRFILACWVRMGCVAFWCSQQAVRIADGVLKDCVDK